MSAEVFPSVARPLPEPMARGFVSLRPVSEMPVPVRFVEGFEQFESYVRDQGEDPGRLAGSLPALWSFLARRSDVLDSASLAGAAARFAGNVLALAHPAATWRVTDEPEVGTSTRSFPVAALVRMMVEHPERRDPFMDMFATWSEDDRDEQELHDLTRERSGRALVLPPVPFQRPPFPQRTFRDADGQVIEYGSRWPDHEPPKDAYSRMSNPDRFAPLLLDIDALIDYLQQWYLVEVDRDDTEGGTLRVHLRPAAGAEVTLAATVESVQVNAGALFRDVVPDCACDACDESADSEAERLEDVLLSIAAGGLRERYPLGRKRWLHTEVHHADGGHTGSGGDPDHTLTATQLQAAATSLRHLDDGWWPAWTLRYAPA